MQYKNPTHAFIQAKTKRFFVTLGPLLCGILLIGMAMLALPMTETRADGPDQAHIVFQFSNTDIAIRPISFTAPISNYTALQLTGLDLITTSSQFGIGVCAIEGLGNPADNCFSGGFWASYFWDGQVWQTYLSGPSSSMITNGSVVLWSWQENFVSLRLPHSPAPLIAASEGLTWLQAQQSVTDGSYSQSTSSSLDTMLAVKANRLDPKTWQRQGDSPSLADYLIGQAISQTNISGNQLGRADIAGKYLTAFAAMDNLLRTGTKSPLDFYNSSSGIFTGAVGIGTGPQAWAIIGTAAASQTVPITATQYLRDQSQTDGSWEWQLGFGGDTNATALALQALVATGEPATSSAIRCGLAYLKSAQNNDGGFAYTPGGKSDANSTAWGVQALWATQQNPFSATWTISNTNPISFLLTLQLADGSFAWRDGATNANILATQQAIPALLGTPLPLHMTLLPPVGSALFGSALGSCHEIYLPLIQR